MSTPEVSNGKRNVVLYLDQHLVQEAKNTGINLSRFLEYDLKLFLSRMKQANPECSEKIRKEPESVTVQNGGIVTDSVGVCGGWDSRTSLLVKCQVCSELGGTHVLWVSKPSSGIAIITTWT
jgi:hypothetical protein